MRDFVVAALTDPTGVTGSSCAGGRASTAGSSPPSACRVRRRTPRVRPLRTPHPRPRCLHGLLPRHAGLPAHRLRGPRPRHVGAVPAVHATSPHRGPHGGRADQGVHHIVFEVEDIDQVGYALERATRAGHPITASLGRHKNDRVLSFYMRSPAGFEVEIGCDARLVDERRGWSTTSPAATSGVTTGLPETRSPRRSPAVTACGCSAISGRFRRCRLACRA